MHGPSSFRTAGRQTACAESYPLQHRPTSPLSSSFPRRLLPPFPLPPFRHCRAPPRQSRRVRRRRHALGIRRPKLDLGPIRRLLAAQRTEMSYKRGWRATPDPRAANGVGLGPQIKFGATDLWGGRWRALGASGALAARYPCSGQGQAPRQSAGMTVVGARVGRKEGGAGMTGEACHLLGRVRPCSGLFGFVQVCSALFGVFGSGQGLFPIWSGCFWVFGSWSGVFRFVRFCSGCSGPAKGCSLSGQGAFGCSGLGRVCSGLFGSVRGGALRRGGRRRAWVGPLCCCGGATVSRCRWDGALGAASGEIPVALFRHCRAPPR